MKTKLRAIFLVAIVIAASACIPVGPQPSASEPWEQNSPQVASDGTNALVVWRDYRNGGGNGDIFAALVASDQSVISLDIAISTQPGTESSPNVAFDGTNYVVAWGDRRGGDADLYATRVSPTGQVLDTGGVLLAGGAAEQRRPALAFDGTNYLVVYEETTATNTGISAKRIAPDLTILDTSPLSLATAGKDALFADVVFDGAGFYAAWTETALGNSDIMSRRVSTAGVAGAPIPITNEPANNANVTMAFDGTNTMVMYVNLLFGGSYRIIKGQRVDTAGTVVDPAPVLFEHDEDADLYFPKEPDLTWDGEAYVIAYSFPTDYRTPGYLARVDAAGTRLTPRIALEALDSPRMNDLNQIALTMVDGIAFTAFSATNFESLDYDGAIGTSGVNNADEVLTGSALTSRPANQFQRAVAFGDDTFLLVWGDFTGTYAALFDDRLQPLGGAPINLEITGGFSFERPITVDFNGTNFIVIGEDQSTAPSSNTRAVTISPTGAVVNSVLLAGMDGARGRSVASAGSESLVSASGFGGIRTMLLDVNGLPVSTPVFAVTQTVFAEITSTWDGTQFHLAWQDGRNSTTDIYATRVAADGTPLDTTGTPIAFSGASETDPRITASSNEVAIVWEQSFNGVRSVQAQTVASDGTAVGSAVTIASDTSFDPRPEIVDRDGFVVAWVDQDGTEYDIDAARFTPGATTSLGTVVTSQANPQALNLAAAVPGVVALAYNDIDPDDGTTSALWRIFYS